MTSFLRRRKRPLEMGVHIEMPPDVDVAQIAEELRFAFGGAVRVEQEVPVAGSFAEPFLAAMVHYVSYGTPGGEYPSVCRAAVVTAVKNSTTVDLFVMNPTGIFHNQGCFFVGPHGPGYDEETKTFPGGTWHWPCDRPE